MQLVARDKSEQNRAVIDPWTVVHFGFGLAAGLMRLPEVPVVAAAVAYEVFERHVETKVSDQNFFKTSGPEIPANAVFDVVVYWMAYRLGKKWR